MVLLLLGLFLGRIVLTYRIFNDTTDENIHIAAGMEILERGKYTVELQHPPVARFVVGALPYLVAGLRLEGHERLWYGGPWSKADPELYWRSLALARAGNLVFAGLLFAVVYWWSRSLHGPRGAVLACLVVACCPNLIAHSSLATLDAGAAATTVLGAYALRRWSAEPTAKRGLAAAAAFSFATLTKFSALSFLVPLGALYWCLAAGRRRRMLATLPAMAVVFLAAVWTAYLFQGGRPDLPRYAQRPANLIEKTPVAGRLVPYLFSEGMAEVHRHNLAGHQNYLFGKSSTEGWWYYFPVALAVKSTLPLLALAGIGIWGGRRNRALLYPGLAVAVILGVAMTARINIGVRHVLAIYPLLAILAGGAWAEGGRALRLAVIALATWHAAESALVHPHYLAYFNQIARGREDYFLGDSNLDWGQDLANLGRYLREHGIAEVQLRFTGVTEPEKVGVKARPLPAGDPDPGWVAISVQHIAGTWYDHYSYEWFHRRRPVARVGRTIWLYHRNGNP